MTSNNTAPPRPNIRLKTPKGTRDWYGAEARLRDHIFQTITQVFTNHGGTPLDTPVFELRDILAGKYGEDSRLIYDLDDQGGELCSLRYDLTVPFARWLAMQNFQQIKRYQIAKVYRRDQPAMTRGRYREFYQCDFDIAGIYDPMIPDAEILRVIVEIFKALELPITIKLNHRRILDGLFAVCGVPEEKMRSISSAVDKLDKLPWPLVKKEIVEEKGLAEEVADRIGVYVQRSGSLDSILHFLKSDAELSANLDIKAGLADLDLLLPYSRAMKVYENISFDLSLARGLDYYSGLIYEVVLSDPASQVGSIAAGGRYDNLVGMYGKRRIPCVGVSFGVDRIFTLLSTGQEKSDRDIDVFIATIGEGLLVQRMEVAGLLWEAGIKAEFSAKVKPRVQQQFAACEGVPVVVILGKAEWESGCVRVKAWRDEVEKEKEKDRGQLVAREDLVKEVRRLLTERE